MPRKEKVEEEIIKIGRRLYDLRLVTARAGNLSARLDKHNILITATGTALGNLSKADIVKVNLSALAGEKNKRPSSELPLHSLIYQNFPAKVIIHCHPPLTNAYFAVYYSLKALTFETNFYLGDVPLVEQSSLTVTKPELVIRALRKNKLAVVKNHGVFSISESFSQALERIEILEEAVRVTAVARLFKRRALDKLDKELKKSLTRLGVSQ
jgi:L-fuculose-phosphate aldolase